MPGDRWDSGEAMAVLCRGFFDLTRNGQRRTAL